MNRRIALALLFLAGCTKTESTTAPVTALEDAGVVAPAALAAVVATCSRMDGTVEVKRLGESTWHPVEIGMSFRVGDWVRAAAEASARIEFLNGGGLDLGSGALVVIDLAAPEQGVTDAGAPLAQVEVKQGEVVGFLDAKKPAPLVIKSADGSAAKLTSRGGDARVRVSATSHGTELVADTGAVSVTSKSGEAVVEKGKAVEISKSGATLVATLDFPESVAPAIDARIQFVAGQKVTLSWKPVPGAVGYRVEIARDLAFTDGLRVVDVTATSYDYAPKVTGGYTWRVATRDENLRVGEYGFARRLFCETEAPRDLLVAPNDGQNLGFVDAAPPITFTWQPGAGTPTYLLVLAKGPDVLKDKVLSREVDEPKAVLEMLAPGDYQWGVYIEGPILEPIFLKPRKLSLHKVEKARLSVPKSISEWGK